MAPQIHLECAISTPAAIVVVMLSVALPRGRMCTVEWVAGVLTTHSSPLVYKPAVGEGGSDPLRSARAWFGRTLLTNRA